MRVQTEERRRFIPGIRMYNGKLTYFYNGEELVDRETGEFLIYDREEREKWEVIMVLPGVELIPPRTFKRCENVKVVVMCNSVKRIEEWAFSHCWSLTFVRLSRNIEYIGDEAFLECNFTSIFIPESCRIIRTWAFLGCKKLNILSVPRNTTLGNRVIGDTALIKASPFETDPYGHYKSDISDEVNEWIKNINQGEEFALHCECASIEPSEDNIYEIVKQRGLPSIHVKNQIGVTPLEYLQENPFIENQIDQHKLIKRLVLDLMGEIIA